MRAVVRALVALLIAIVGLGPVTAAEATQAQTLVTYAYDASRHVAPPMGGITERGPPAAYDHATYDAVANWSHGAEARSEGPAPADDTDYDHPGTLAEIAWATGTTDWEAQTNYGSSFAFERSRVAAKSGFNVVPGGSGTRAINFKPNAADPNWGLTSAHLNKHMFGTGKNSLRTIDAGGNPDLWRNYMQDLAGRPVTNTLKGGIEDIIGTFPKADGSGTFQFGIRIAPSSNGSHDLVTLLTRQ